MEDFTIDELEIIVEEMDAKRKQMQNILSDWVLHNTRPDDWKDLAYKANQCLKIRAKIKGFINERTK